MKKIALVLSFIAATFGVAKSSSAADDVIRFGVAAEPYAPFSVKDSSGKWQGWEIDLMGAVCKETSPSAVVSILFVLGRHYRGCLSWSTCRSEICFVKRPL